MAENYPKAPITEAVIALHFAQPVAVKALEKFAKKQGKGFSKVEIQRRFEGKIDPKEGRQEGSVHVHGYKLTDADAGLVVMANVNQFGVSKLAPYKDWTELFEFARGAWGDLKKHVGNVDLSMVSTRFINRVDIPNKSNDVVQLGEYFRIGLVIPDELRKLSYVQFHQNCRLQDTQNSLINIINYQSGEPALLDHTSITLDIDVVTTDAVPKKDDDLWNRIDGLRQAKNTLFEAMITDKTRSLFR